MKKPIRSDLANVRVEYYRDWENGFSEEFLVDSHIDKEENIVIDIYKFDGEKWTDAPDDLSVKELDNISELSLQKYLDDIEFETCQFDEE